MCFKVTEQCITQRENRTEHDQDSVEALTEMLRKVADGAPEPHHVKARQANGERSYHIDPAVPAMKERRATAKDWNELQRSADQDDHSRGEMNGDYQIGHGTARGVAMSHGFIPLLPVASCGRKPIERRNGSGEYQLPEDHDDKPEGAFYLVGSIDEVKAE